ncbi:class I SAM-dependent methyltransferase [Psychrobium sp. 1_MG-2023]|uniref:class I SAM-dependent methyltransferase n=1 Tax=Psychrobium sp. 1_MG-2023 TaxID=3062624 RepID=UPI00269CDCBE|nr:class I SAM-dependent methyltransferase [Psychrobium sp. 1_MG-2023]MDP2562441.1 class I SAM-dependent methyltransferase [Psychrobium sp. 1_MG-2023]
MLDVGCGLGGAARFLATAFDVQVFGIDLTQEYIDTGNVLCQWLNLDKKVQLAHGSALSMPYDDASFAGGYMLHVGMNIENKQALFHEVARVLKPGARFAIYDVMRFNSDRLTYPVPWTSNSYDCHLATPATYRDAINNAGFIIEAEHDRRDFAIAFFKGLREKNKLQGFPVLSLHTLMKESAGEKLKNMVSNVMEGRISPVEMIIKKPLQ